MKTWLIIAIVAVAGLVLYFVVLRKPAVQAPKVVTELQSTPTVATGTVAHYDGPVVDTSTALDINGNPLGSTYVDADGYSVGADGGAISGSATKGSSFAFAQDAMSRELHGTKAAPSTAAQTGRGHF
jgi:hypothetical protein